MSKIRKIYFMRLIGRCILLLFTFYLYAFYRETFSVTEGMGFFEKFSPLHLLWSVWVWDMILQLIPAKAHISIGSKKLFSAFFRPIKEKINPQNLRKYAKDTTAAAYKVMIIWILLTAAISVLYGIGALNTAEVVLISTLFYVCDLICVLIWCPFRLIMKNKCCTTCRIFNWDHLMMFSPLLMVNSFFCRTLFILSVCIFIIWEVFVFLYPARFWENSNMALKCSECTDKLCTQYCRKLRK